jgi:hypothetical protein
VIAFGAEKGDFIERVNGPEFRVEFKTVNDPDGIIDPDVFGAQVSMAVHDIMAAGARREQILFRHKEPALSSVDPAYEPQRECQPGLSMAETNCAKWRRENVPVGLREKDLEAPVYFRASAPIYFVVVGSPSFCVLVFWLCP